METRPPTDREVNAFAAAAEAVVAVRLNLPLDTTELTMITKPWSEGKILLGAAGAQLVAGSVQRWVDALPDPEAVKSLTAAATMAAAAVVAEAYRGKVPGEEGFAQPDAWRQMHAIASALGVGEPGEPATKEWVGDRVAEAAKLLESDGKNAWTSLTAELLEKVRLSGEDIRTWVRVNDTMA